jgi:hypothetical protein
MQPGQNLFANSPKSRPQARIRIGQNGFGLAHQSHRSAFPLGPSAIQCCWARSPGPEPDFVAEPCCCTVAQYAREKMHDKKYYRAFTTLLTEKPEIARIAVSEFLLPRPVLQACRRRPCRRRTGCSSLLVAPMPTDPAPDRRTWSRSPWAAPRSPRRPRRARVTRRNLEFLAGRAVEMARWPNLSRHPGHSGETRRSPPPLRAALQPAPARAQRYPPRNRAGNPAHFARGGVLVLIVL